MSLLEPGPDRGELEARAARCARVNSLLAFIDGEAGGGRRVGKAISISRSVLRSGSVAAAAVVRGGTDGGWWDSVNYGYGW